MTESLVDQVALVTGAGRGIGRAIAVGLASAGMHVGLLGRTPGTLDDAVQACREAGAGALAVRADVTRPDDVRLAVGTIERELGPIDLLVNNAGRGDAEDVPLWEVDPADWWEVIETNLRGPMLLCHAVLPGMVQRGRGRVVNISSRAGLLGMPGYSGYSVSKAALTRLTDCMAGSLMAPGLAVFDLSPGLVRTDMTKDLAVWADVADDEWTPPHVVVDALLTLASGRADVLSGRFLHATMDNLDELIAGAAAITEADGRTLRLRPYGPDDPLA